MKKLKGKIIHMLGGMTKEDVLIMTRPVRSYVSHFSIETIRVGNSINPEILRTYPEYIDHAKKDMAYRLADKMIEEDLVSFESKQESNKMLVIHATARVCRPEV